MRVPWIARRSNQSVLKEIRPKYSLEGLMLKLQYFGHLMRRANSLEKTLMLVNPEGRRRRGHRGGWHHQLNGHEFDQAPEWWWTEKPGVVDREAWHGGQRSLACCSAWGCKESDTTEQLNNNKSPCESPWLMGK